MRRWLRMLAVLLVAVGAGFVSAQPAVAAPPCWTSFSNNNPGMAPFTITYYNCASSGEAIVTPYWTTVDRATTGIYEACKHVPALQWRTWTVTAPYPSLNFGVASCYADGVTLSVERLWGNGPCWTPLPVRDGNTFYIDYYNCEERQVRVVPFAVEPDGDVVAYLWIGPAVLDSALFIGDVIFQRYVAHWTLDTPYDSISASVAFAWPYP